MKRTLAPSTVLALVATCFLSTPTLAENVHPAQPLPGAQTAEMFAAVDAGQIDVKFIPTNAARANVLIENKTDQVLHVKLPEAFAAVPVLGQFNQQQGFGLGQAGGGNGVGGGSQGLGGGLNQGGNQGFGLGNRGGQQGNGFGVGFMRIPPQKTRKVKVATVCLEHGKPDPNPRIAYQMIPIEQFTDDDRVVALCRKLGQGLIPQNTAQAAAWHLANGLDWEQIAKLNRVESRYRGNIRFFNSHELAGAKQVVEAIETQLDARKNANRQTYVSQTP
ncbi:MAG: hypothetical protein MI861_03210 [Pirellulales bacterium]|nr:hypothetical protein [Pirellulales bacterium]